MEIDTERVDEPVLGLLLLGLHDGCRVRKGSDWDAMERLHQKGLTSDRVGKAKSVVLTAERQPRPSAFLPRCSPRPDNGAHPHRRQRWQG
jgi:hypothetical protein